MMCVHALEELILDPDNFFGQDQDIHINSPQGYLACLYGLVGEIFRAGNEVN
jgi:hypothetical protein